MIPTKKFVEKAFGGSLDQAVVLLDSMHGYLERIDEKLGTLNETALRIEAQLNDGKVHVDGRDAEQPDDSMGD